MRSPSRLLKKSIVDFFSSSSPVHARTRLRRINHLHDRFAGGASLHRVIRLLKRVFQQPASGRCRRCRASVAAAPPADRILAHDPNGACTMSRILAFLLVAVLPMTVAAAGKPVLVIHGGAGVIRAGLTPQKERAVRADLDEALKAGYAVLESGGSSLDAVSRAIVVLEDSPRFNAGKGAVFTHDGHNELDSAIMDGATLRAGAVAGVRHVRNPVLLARAVMEKSPHVMLSGNGAEQFAQSVGIELVDADYFRTESRWKQLQDALKKDAAGKLSQLDPSLHYGTVGALALDREGHLAAATSTGGMTN